MSLESTTSSQFQEQCSICLDPIDATIRSTARLACGHFFHLDCVGSEFNYRRLMQCPNCRLVEEGEWLFAAGGFQQAFVTDDLDLEDDDDYFDLHPSMQLYLMQNGFPLPNVGLPTQGIRNFHPMVPGPVHPTYSSAGTQAQHNLVPQSQHGPVMNNSVSINVANSQGSHLAQRNLVDVRQSLGCPVHPNPGYGRKNTVVSVIELISNSNTPPQYCYITNPQGQAAVGQAHHTCPGPTIHGWPAVFHSRVAQRPAVSRPVPTADVAGLHAAFFSRRGNSACPMNLDASTSVGQAAQPSPYNVRYLPQQVMGQRMRDRHQHEPSTSTEDDIVDIPYHRFL